MPTAPDPLAEAEQRLRAAGFTTEELATLRTRLQTLIIGAEHDGSERVSIADLTTTPERKAALFNFFEIVLQRGPETP